ncbi:MAG TPA: glycosyl transferase family 2, partial [Candidatus Thermoplasmatota archaeon]
WREGPDRLSRTDPTYGPDAFRRLKVDVLSRTLLRGREGAVVWGAGPTGKAFARALREGGARLRAFVDLDPRKVGQHVYGAPVVAPDGVDDYRSALCVAAVGRPGAREDVREALRTRGWMEMRDFVAVA